MSYGLSDTSSGDLLKRRLARTSLVLQEQCSRSAVVPQGLATRLNSELASGIKSDSAGERTTVYGMNKVEQVRPKLRLCRRVTAPSGAASSQTLSGSRAQWFRLCRVRAHTVIHEAATSDS